MTEQPDQNRPNPFRKRIPTPQTDSPSGKTAEGLNERRKRIEAEAIQLKHDQDAMDMGELVDNIDDLGGELLPDPDAPAPFAFVNDDPGGAPAGTMPPVFTPIELSEEDQEAIQRMMGRAIDAKTGEPSAPSKHPSDLIFDRAKEELDIATIHEAIAYHLSRVLSLRYDS